MDIIGSINCFFLELRVKVVEIREGVVKDEIKVVETKVLVIGVDINVVRMRMGVDMIGTGIKASKNVVGVDIVVVRFGLVIIVIRSETERRS